LALLLLLQLLCALSGFFRQALPLLIRDVYETPMPIDHTNYESWLEVKRER